MWEFRVAEEKREEFERAYRANGDWAQLFARAKGFSGTTLLRDPAIAGRYVTLDVWESVEAFDKFKREFADKYKELDLHCEDLTEYEMKIGAFETL